MGVADSADVNRNRVVGGEEYRAHHTAGSGRTEAALLQATAQLGGHTIAIWMVVEWTMPSESVAVSLTS